MSYMAGTVAVTAGAVAVTGEGTAWLGAVAAGDLLVGPEGRSYPIAAVASNTALTLEVPYRGRSQVGGRYQIMPAVTGTPSVGVAALAAQAEQAAAEAAAAAQGLTNGSANLSAASATLAGQQVKALQFDNKAAFAAASLPAWVREWSIRDGDLLLSYLRDDAGTAIQSANGVKGKPIGRVMPEHFDIAAGVHGALAAWAAVPGDHVALPGAVYVSAARTAPIIFAAASAFDFQGATFRQDWTLNNNNGVLTLNAAARVENLVWHVTGENFHQRGATLYAGAQAVGWRIEADTPMPATDDNYDGGLILRGPDVLIQGCEFHGHGIPIRMYDGDDQSRCRIVDCHIWDYMTGVSLRGSGWVGGVIDGLYIHSVHPAAGTDPGRNAVTGAGEFALVRAVKQMFDGKGSGEHFIYSAGNDGVKGMRFEDCSSNGSGQCFFKARGHDGLQLTDMHGGPTSVGNVPGTNEDGFRFEHCRNVKGRDLSVRSDPVNPSGYDGVHINNCWDMDLAGLRFGHCQRAYVRIINPSVGLVDYTYPPAGAPDNIVIDGLFARGAGTKPLLSIGAGSGDAIAKVGNITIRGVDWDGSLTSLVVVADDEGNPITLEQLPGTAIRISGFTNGLAFNYVWGEGSTPVYTTASPDGGTLLRLAGGFVATDGDNSALRIGSNTPTVNQGDLGGGISWLKPASSRPWNAIVGMQTGPDPDQGGFAFFAHGSATTSDELFLRAILDHNGRFELIAAGQGVRMKSPDGTISRTLTIGNSGAILSDGGPVPLPTYTVAGLPAAASYAGAMVYVSNESGGPVTALSDGINWRRVTDRAIVS